MGPHRILHPLVLLGVIPTKRPYKLSGSEESGTEAEEGENKFSEEAFHAVLEWREKGVSTTSL